MAPTPILFTFSPKEVKNGDFRGFLKSYAFHRLPYGLFLCDLAQPEFRIMVFSRMKRVDVIRIEGQANHVPSCSTARSCWPFSGRTSPTCWSCPGRRECRGRPWPSGDARFSTALDCEHLCLDRFTAPHGGSVATHPFHRSRASAPLSMSVFRKFAVNDPPECKPCKPCKPQSPCMRQSGKGDTGTLAAFCGGVKACKVPRVRMGSERSGGIGDETQAHRRISSILSPPKRLKQLQKVPVSERDAPDPYRRRVRTTIFVKTFGPPGFRG